MSLLSWLFGRGTGCLASPAMPGAVSALAAYPPLPASATITYWLPAAGDQGRQSSCVAWAISRGMTLLRAQRTEARPDTPDRQASPAYIYNQRPTPNCRSDRGMTLIAGLRIAAQGNASLSVMPYNERDTCTRPSAGALAVARDWPLRRYALLWQDKANPDALRATIASGRPVLLGIPVSTGFLRCRSSAAIGSSRVGFLFGSHAVLAVAYDDARGVLVLNSWGLDWGKNGKGWITWGYLAQAFEAWALEEG